MCTVPEVTVALLRAVNVGGRTVRSADLRAAAAELGHQRVATYAASGNAVLVPSPDSSPETIGPRLSRALGRLCGFAVPVLTRSGTQWDRLVADVPFTDHAADDPSRLTVVCWEGTPDEQSVGTFDAARYGEEQVAWHGEETYVYYPHGIGRSRLTLDVLSRAAGRVGTARNWRTVLALQSLVDERR
ncbi:MAG: hypothetical protein B7X40_10175 [Cellulomonas sp. 14-74-6]|nr:MAG: hypothetical protein B7X40_10175 [Cellulomonas sp. 14-74-6]